MNFAAPWCMNPWDSICSIALTIGVIAENKMKMTKWKVLALRNIECRKTLWPAVARNCNTLPDMVEGMNQSFVRFVQGGKFRHGIVRGGPIDDGDGCRHSLSFHLLILIFILSQTYARYGVVYVPLMAAVIGLGWLHGVVKWKVRSEKRETRNKEGYSSDVMCGERKTKNNRG